MYREVQSRLEFPPTEQMLAAAISNGSVVGFNTNEMSILVFTAFAL
jgi:hypothetical protein